MYRARNSKLRRCTLPHPFASKETFSTRNYLQISIICSYEWKNKIIMLNDFEFNFGEHTMHFVENYKKVLENTFATCHAVKAFVAGDCVGSWCYHAVTNLGRTKRGLNLANTRNISSAVLAALSLPSSRVLTLASRPSTLENNVKKQTKWRSTFSHEAFWAKNYYYRYFPLLKNYISHLKRARSWSSWRS